MVESAYEDGMCIELAARGLRFRRQARFDAEYKGRRFEKRYRIDLLVEDEVVVEIKAVREVTDVHPAQLLTYLRHTRKRVGLLLNFNVALLRDGIHRRVL